MVVLSCALASQFNSVCLCGPFSQFAGLSRSALQSGHIDVPGLWPHIGSGEQRSARGLAPTSRGVACVVRWARCIVQSPFRPGCWGGLVLAACSGSSASSGKQNCRNNNGVNWSLQKANTGMIHRNILRLCRIKPVESSGGIGKYK